MRYPSRLLTDERQRAFATRQSRGGGVVVIDQSGSMDVSADDIEQLLRAAPDAVIVGYSHRPGDLGATPNAWILARQGGVAVRAPASNIGNGVDGPILRWALQRARGGPVVWVTDGQVTDSHDHPCDRLTLECALLVRDQGIRLARTVQNAAAALRGRRYDVTTFGRVGRRVIALRDVTGLR